MARYLLDTNILIMVLQHGQRLTVAQKALLSDTTVEPVVSAVSVWEMSIKWRKGKLTIRVTPEEAIPVLGAMGIGVIPLERHHAVADPQLNRKLKDPFDRMVVAIAEQENIPFVTTDKQLLDHPLAWRP